MAKVRDVAARAGVSPATVSRALGSQVAVSPALRERVLAAAEEFGYRPNPVAQSLRRGQMNIVAFLVGDIEQSHFAVLTKQVQATLAELGADLMLHNLAHREDRLARFLTEAPGMTLRGVVLASSDVVTPGIGSLLERALGAGVHVVSAGQDLTAYKVPSVVYDERGAARASVDHLLRGGARRVAYLGRIARSAVGTERYLGYCEALVAGGIEVDPALVWDRAFRFEAGLSATSDALARGVDFDAIQAGSDELAVGAIAALQDAGRKVPQEVEVIGFGNVEISSYVRPGLTTLSSHPEEMARHIGELIEAAPAPGAPCPLIRIERGLVRRQSA